jgi:hypothetical protein
MSSHRLEVLIPTELDAAIEEAALRDKVSKGEWVRRALRRSVRPGKAGAQNPVEQMARLGGPTCDIGQMLAEIEAGRH